MKTLAFRAGEKPRREQLYRELREALRRGKFQPGDRFYSDRSLMRKHGLSLKPVRNAMDRLVEEGIIERRRGSGTYVTTLMPAVLGLEPLTQTALGPAATKLTPRQLRIGLIPYHRGWEQGGLHPFYHSLSQRAVETGHLVVNLPWYAASKTTGEYLKSLELDILDAIVWVQPSVQTVELLREIKTRGMPLVVFNRRFLELSLHEVAMDYLTGAYLATRHLLHAGHERIALVMGPSQTRSLAEGEGGGELLFQECSQGYSRAMLAHGMQPNESLVLEGEYGVVGKQIVPFLERTRATAVVFATSSFLIMFLQAEGHERWSIPRELSVISGDNLRPQIAERWPDTRDWTWIHVPLAEVGRMALAKAVHLCQHMEPPSRTLLPMTLVEGHSVAPPRP